MNIERIQHYIDYFSKDDFEFFSKNGWPYNYDSGVDEFINEFYQSDLIDTNYLETMNKHQKSHIELIKVADKDLLKSILTSYVRGERFSEGTWAEAISNKIFLNILIKLKELEEEAYI
ncbi:DUF6508 domain-containing protein [Bacillus sp. AFS041924]|uniref:DUF6508 domain-containing protein n=1 Tax=Bacillus sp. AFS041924 TaxID=2033503 RepID=UPI000BFD9C9B|nr:DUF6508 domain-containing protein [Bacillus sp. AFS041924]PGS54256.1 hypothetical protein COC46_05995 [Bacillus sp. AFS041924]